jgi:glycosyltransferase involved in cell wall biosynthesis
MTNPGRNEDQIDITILVTCYNEADYIVDTLEHVVAALGQTTLSYEIIVIDDESRDNSVARVNDYVKSHPSYPIQLHVNERNRGLANNFVEGAFYGRGRYYHMVCGDNAAPVECLATLYRLVGKADMIIPYQIQSEVVGKSAGRKRLSDVFTAIVNILGGYKLKYYNGLPVYLRHNIMRWHPTSYGFGFQADTITMLLDEGHSYIQVYAWSVNNKGSGSTAVTTRNLLSVCHTLLEIFFRRIRRMLYGKSWPKPVEIELPEESSRGGTRKTI